MSKIGVGLKATGWLSLFRPCCDYGKTSRLEKKGTAKSKNPKGKRASSKKKKKTAKLKIHKDEHIEPEHIPDGSRFLGYNDFVVQGLKSDDVGQFNILRHGLCWINANRAIEFI